MYWTPVNTAATSKAVFAAVFAAALLAAAPAAADQDDPALDDLFHALYEAGAREEIRAVEAAIQRLWGSSGSDTADLLLSRGTAALNAGNYEAALETLNAVVELAPGFAEGWNRRATLFYVMGRLDDSIADIERTLALAPRHYGALAGLGQIYVIENQPEDAARAFRRALAANPHLMLARRFLEALEGSGGLDI